MKNQISAMLSLFVLSFQISFAQPALNPWQQVQLTSEQVAAKSKHLTAVPEAFKVYSLRQNTLEKALQNAPDRFAANSRASTVSLWLPMPDGTFELFEVLRASVMHPDLAKRYPEIQSYAAQGIERPQLSARFDVSPKGFGAIILGDKAGMIFIDPVDATTSDKHLVYYKKDYPVEATRRFECTFENEVNVLDKIPVTDAQLRVGDCLLRTYDLALACTGEYAQFHGGTTALVLAEMNRAITRINGIYERDLTVTLRLVADNYKLIFLNPSEDPYTNGSESTMMAQNQSACDDIIGSSYYDIGHVFGTGGGGIANIRAVCNSNTKARGVTSLPNPTGDPFWVDFVAHEMGHQFGANHTQNNNCGRVSSASVEPGSGSTIMSYAGICSPNVQNQVDDYFHAHSLFEISAFITNGGGDVCPSKTTIANSQPVADAGPDKTLPINTPFVLTGSATDADGEASLTYTWEQIDPQIANMPPVCSATQGPAFRSTPPSASPSRYFPNLGDLVLNIDPVWEVLPCVSRNMNFRFTVRDNNLGAGCTAEDDLTLTFDDNFDNFHVTAPDVNAEWVLGTDQTVTWDVANTDNAPVSCANVDILLSTDGGLTFPVVLATQVPNDGVHTVSVPTDLTVEARVMVKCSDSYFFDISDENFTIKEPLTPTFLFTASPEAQILCGTSDATYTLDLDAIVGFDEAVTLTLAGVPAGAIATFSDNNILPDAQVDMTVTGLENVAPGSYNLTVTGKSATVEKSITLHLEVYNGLPLQANLLTPADGAKDIFSEVTLTWEQQVNANSYLLEVAFSPAFGNSTVLSVDRDDNFAILTGLPNNTFFYWRVSPSNPCGTGVSSPIWAFKTVNPICTTYDSDDVPVILPNSSPGNYFSDLNINDTFNILDVNVTVDIAHSWIGDLQAWLNAPGGERIELFDRPGQPGLSQFGCDNDDIEVTFDDDAAATDADFENTCTDGVGPAISGEFQPIGKLADLNNTNAQGTWSLEIRDNASEDGGSIRAWSLELCHTRPTVIVPTLVNNLTLPVDQDETKVITNVFLKAESQGNTADQIEIQLRTVPAEGTLLLSGFPLAHGAVFTQADINDGNLSYQHDGGTIESDQFVFDVFNAESGWLAGGIFQISITINSLTANLVVDREITCFNGSDGQISVVAADGNPPYQYRLNNGSFQSNSVFSGLSSDAYTVTVRDASNFTVTTNTVTLTNPAQININAVVNGDALTINASGGTGTLSYSIDGSTFQSSHEFFDLDNGSYTVTVKDDNDCTATTTAIIAVNNLVVSAQLESGISCHDDDNAIISVSAAGGRLPYEYQLNGGAFQSENRFENLGAGDYTITVRDADGLTRNTNTVTIINPEQITAGTTVNGNDVTINASGGTGTLRYSLDGQIFQTSNIFNGLSNGDYTATIKDANRCLATTDFNIFINDLSVSLIVVQHPSCAGTSDGVLEVNVSGGTPPYTYNLNNNGDVNDNLFQNLPAGNYTVVVMDDSGFTRSSNSVELIAPEALSATATVDGYDIAIDAEGGTPPFQYSLAAGPFQSSNTFKNNPNGTYTIVIRDNNGCEFSLMVTVSVPDLSATTVINDSISCNGENNGAVAVNVTGGIGPYEYSIDGGQTYQDNNVFSGLSADTYTITVRDAGGFSTTTTVVLTEPTIIQISFEIVNQELIIIASGGNASFEYSVNGSAFTSQNVFSDFQYGALYTVVVRDANGCERSGTIEIDALDILATVGQVSCFGAADGTILMEGSGGIPPYEYSIDGGVSWSDNGLFTNLTSGIYAIRIRDQGGFEFDGSLEIIEPEVLILQAETRGDSLILFAAGGTPPYEYSIDGLFYQQDPLFLNLADGAYQVFVRDDNGCRADINIMITATGDLEPALDFTLFPNPAKTQLNLRLIQPDFGQYEIQLMDVLGQVVYQQHIIHKGGTSVYPLNINALMGGSYLLRIGDNEKQIVRKVIILK